jgi:hypothetical protein
MARIVVTSYAMRFPLGGYLSWVLQWLVGFHRLGNDVYFVEMSGWSNNCYDPSKDVMSDDCSYGITVFNGLLSRFGLQDKWCFADSVGNYYGLSRERVRAVFESADLFVDMGVNEWVDEASKAKLKVFIDGEPAYTQMRWQQSLEEGEQLPQYDFYYTVGKNIGTSASTSPTAGKRWCPIFDPVNVDLFNCHLTDENARFTTVMSWRAHKPIKFNGTIYGQKDVEFEKFIELPRLTNIPLEIAVGGAGRESVPTRRLKRIGWHIRSALTASKTYDVFLNYIQNSKGEFSVCKNVFVATNSGFFSERTAAYLASARPAVVQDTGFSDHLPCGRGLFAVRTAREAADAIGEISSDYRRHSRWARELAFEYLDTSRVLRDFLVELGI